MCTLFVELMVCSHCMYVDSDLGPIYVHFAVPLYATAEDTWIKFDTQVSPLTWMYNKSRNQYNTMALCAACYTCLWMTQRVQGCAMTVIHLQMNVDLTHTNQHHAFTTKFNPMS